VESWTPKIGSIIDWFGQLQQVDVQDVPPALRAMEDTPKFRSDVEQELSSESRAELVSMFPESEGGMVKVPKIGSGADISD